MVQGDLLRRDTVLPWGDAVLLPAAEGDEALLLQTAEGLAGSAGEIAQVVNRGLAALGQKRRSFILPGGGPAAALQTLQHLLRRGG